MPNQDPTQNQQDNSTVTPVAVPEPPQIDPQSSMPVGNDLPPLPDFMLKDNESMMQDNAIPPTPSPDESFGSAAPSDLPPMVAAPKKKFGGKRIIATILGIFLLVGGIGAGIILTQQQQLFQQKATGGINLEYECGGFGGLTCGACEECVYDGSSTRCKAIPGCSVNVPTTAPTEPPEEPNPPNPPSNPTPTPGPGASCQSVKAYTSSSSTSSWTLLTSSDLSALTGGTVINFCVAGTADTGSFDKAQFTITYFTGGEDGVATVMPETTTKRPSSEDFCQSFTIPLNANSIIATAKIHHTTLGWK
jgi:hypothetical protein